MSAARRGLLVALVLTNLAFVQITEAADWTWLGPLLALTLASPLLIRLRRLRLYRILWNLAVVAVFALLVHHTTGAGVHLLLEDGLLLAALCQVHILNNIGPDQKPDLLLFNSFLIPVVTSFLCIDLNYLLVFLFYAPLLVLTMQVLAMPKGAGTPGRVLGAGLPKVATVLGLTLLVFLFLPRDFHRRGLLGDRFHFRPPGGMLSVEFSEEVSLGQTGKVRAGDRVVMKVEVERGAPSEMPTHFRGCTLDRFDGRRWSMSAGGKQCYLRAPGARRGQSRDDPLLRVRLLDARANRLFVPLSCRGLRVEPPGDSGQVVPVRDGTYLYPRSPSDRRGFSYVLRLTAGESTARLPSFPAPFLALPPDGVPSVARRLARSLSESLPPGASQADRVERFRHHLASQYRYLAPGEEGAAASLEEFLEGGAGGHCEYFATALAVLLRIQGIPCRLVTGYRSEEWRGSSLTIRARHAHAWVEVLDPVRGWTTVDPSPSVDWGSTEDGMGILERLSVLATRLWDKVTGFDSDARDRALAWLGSAPGRLARDVGERPLPYGAVVGGLLAISILRARRRRRRAPKAVADYRRELRRSGIVRRPEETPRELLDRARIAVIHPRRIERLEAATHRHETVRYQEEAGQSTTNSPGCAAIR